jgi:hypothetical protein
MNQERSLFDDGNAPQQIMRKQKRKKSLRGFEKWLEDFLCQIAHPSADKQHPPVAALAYRLPSYVQELTDDTAKLHSLLGAMRLLRQAGGPGSRMSEREIMRWLAHIMMRACRKYSCGKQPRSPILSEKNAIGDDRSPYLDSAKEIYRYALECFSFFRKRDSFGGGRRALAFEIFSWAAPVFELPEAEALARQALVKKNSEEAELAAEFLASYCRCRGKPLERKDVVALEKIAEEAGSYSIAMSALNALVESGEMTEMEALFSIDDWKEKRKCGGSRRGGERNGMGDLWGR